MANQFAEMEDGPRWHFLVGAAKRALEEHGYELARVPGRGLSNVWTATKNGENKTVSIRTTRDRYIAYPPLADGTKWKTLDEVDRVVVAAVDSKDDPKNIEVYDFPAEDVRQRFNAAYQARSNAGHVNRDNFGMWVGLDPDDRGIPSSVGAGIVKKYKPIGLYSVDELLAQPSIEGSSQMVESLPETDRLPRTIAEVMAWARKRIAEIAGVSPEAVRLELKVELP